MSKDKHRSWGRQIALLQTIEKFKEGIIIQHEGGIARDTPELQKLVTAGYVEIPKGKTPPKWTKQFSRMFGLNTSLHGHAPRLFASITPKGRDLLERLSFKL